MKKKSLMMNVLVVTAVFLTFSLLGVQSTMAVEEHHQQGAAEKAPTSMESSGSGMMSGSASGGGRGMMGMMGGPNDASGQGMMGMMGGQGMGSGMMHGGMSKMSRNKMAECGWVPGMKNFTSPESHTQFLEDTKELRRNLHNLRFEYGEKARTPETTIGELQKMEEQMSDLQKQIREKAAQQAQ